MISLRKTPVAVLRQEIGQSVEQFAALIGKSVSAVTKLENGQLKLSAETAFKIAEETGIAVEWLLNGDATEKPYILDEVDGHKRWWGRKTFELVQVHNQSGVQIAHKKSPAPVRAFMVVADFVSIRAAAEKAGKEELADYLMRQFLSELAERFGRDDKESLRCTKKARLIAQDGSSWAFIGEGGSITFAKAKGA
jgi:transcriptional regulator with XRE-family HTH domain